MEKKYYIYNLKYRRIVSEAFETKKEADNYLNKIKCVNPLQGAVVINKFN